MCITTGICVWQVKSETHCSLIFVVLHTKGEQKNDPPHLPKKATTQHGSCREIPNKLEMQ